MVSTPGLALTNQCTQRHWHLVGSYVSFCGVHRTLKSGVHRTLKSGVHRTLKSGVHRTLKSGVIAGEVRRTHGRG